ncbi:hypothetical protein PUNSTDRAFT_89610 [Punctularia strigosozonata HHB-11173 SS5]|uniref:uncharacterized protein n=1 Tax=Punctularia strigosozonata (strain HHB-11173) TaxID=741275 RepID=UPI0004416B34|nr:uncharacterized protein PUNSTDRAFT_89610 [Punctularia strigosozonata HHB-11173 SS5]EIN07360.1 hypothetical protein PUNSTDRAFT_89610 [Punctularia strigosozonata HHB-11173 SS5]
MMIGAPALARAVLAGLSLASLARSAVLVDFQVQNPPPVPSGVKTCTVQLLEHTFGNSYYVPGVTNYTPPTGCGSPGTWTAVTLNLTVTSNGTQYDRLGVLTLQNVEIWRTSTPEPTQAGIIWTYVKDVTKYIPLFAESGTFSFELNNIVTSSLNGQYAATVTATFYESSAAHPAAGKSDLIIPIGRVTTSGGAEVSVPPSYSQNVTLPQNAVAVYAELYASGNGDEEFWYFNTANDALSDLPSGYIGDGPFREVRLLVDGKLAGVAYPYATIFTGGIVPTAWRPITSYGALDLPTYFIDLTPFIPIIADGNSHNFTVDVASAESDHVINSNWYLSANLQVVKDTSSKPTTGKINVYTAEPYGTANNDVVVGDNGDLTVTVTASRKVFVESTIKSGSGKTTIATWSQNLQYKNVQQFLNDTYVQIVTQTASGTSIGTHNGIPVVSDAFSYPLTLNYDVLTEDGSAWYSSFDQSYDRVLEPTPFILSSTIKERQLADGTFVISSSGNYGNGTNNNTFSYIDGKGNTYFREVGAALNNITYDHVSGSLATGGWSWFEFPSFSPKAAATMKLAGARVPKGKH